MLNLKIRKAVESDVKLILDFIKQLADYEKLSQEVIATENDILESIFSNESNVEVIFGYLEKKPVAFAIYFNNYSTFLGKKGLYLEDLFVVPQERNNGIGKAMLHRIKNTAIANGCKSLTLGTETYMKSYHLYKRSGFIVTAEHIIEL